MVRQTTWKNDDLEASLRRAFVDGEADYVVVDGQVARNEFLISSLQLGLDRGWLYKGDDIDEDRALGHGVGQYFAYTYRLTDKGKNHFGVKIL